MTMLDADVQRKERNSLLASLRHMQRNDEARALAWSSAGVASGGARVKAVGDSYGQAEMGCLGPGDGGARRQEVAESATGDTGGKQVQQQLPLRREQSVGSVAYRPSCTQDTAADGSGASVVLAVAAAADAHSDQGCEVVSTPAVGVGGSLPDVAETPDRG